MMRKVKARVPECGAIKDSDSSSGLSAERYGQVMSSLLTSKILEHKKRRSAKGAFR